MSEHRFQLQAVWEGGRLGTGHIQGNGLQTAISIPAELDGPGQGTNPEELLIGAAMNCYIITLAAILEKREIRVASLTLQSEGVLTVEAGNLGFRQIIHRPHIRLASPSAKQLEQAEQAAFRAEQVCMISKALHGNVQLTVEPRIEAVSAE